MKVIGRLGIPVDATTDPELYCFCAVNGKLGIEKLCKNSQLSVK